MAQGDGPLAVDALGIGAARGQVVGDSLDRGQVGRSLIKTQFASYSAHNPYRLSVGEWLRAAFQVAPNLLHQSKK